MMVIDPTALLIQGEDGEIITVKVSKLNTVFQVTYNLDDQDNVLAQGDSIQFTLSSSDIERILTLSLDFTPADGTGKYTVTVRGDRGGDPFRRGFKPNAGIDRLVKPYTFIA